MIPLRPIVLWLPEELYGCRDACHRLARGTCRPAFPLSHAGAANPFFILGAGRSGNTLLRRMLSAADGIFIPEETYFFRELISQARRTASREWNTYVAEMATVIASHCTGGRGFPSVDEMVKAACALPAAEQSLAGIINCFYCLTAERHDHRNARWGDKTPMYTYSAKGLLQVFPGARCIHMLRDGVDVADSYVRAGLCPTHRQAAGRWIRANRRLAALKHTHPERVHVVRYEALVAAPEETLRRVCSFLDLPFSPDMVHLRNHVREMGDVTRLPHHGNVADPVATTHIGKGRRSLDSKQRRRLGRILKSALEQWGYPPLTEGAHGYETP